MQPAENMSDFYMPDELLTKIFTYLPPKSLVRFSCVCKLWQSIITDSDFITDHLNQTKISNNINKTHLFLVRYLVRSTEERYSLHIDNNRTFDLYDIIELPRRSDVDKCFRILGSCNGLICLSDDYVESFIFHYAQHCFRKKTVILWNPSIRKSVTLPPPPPDPDYMFLADETFVHVLGFGFDLRTNDYKVVRITCLKSDKGQSPTVQLYKLSTGSWETITPAIDPSCSVYKSATQAFINGAVHWPAFKSDIGSLILSFNMSDDVFHEIRFPVSVAGNHYRDRMNISVVVGGKRLCYIDYGENSSSNSFSIWVMKEYGVVESWTKLYSIDLSGESIGLKKMLGFRRNGELLLAMRNNQLVSYNRRTCLIKYLGECESYDPWTPCSFHVDGYVESLVLPGNDM